MTYLIIDESGDLGKRGSKFFIVLGILIENEKELERIIKDLRRNKFKKKLAKVREIKGTQYSSKLIKQIIRKINKLNAEIYCIVFEKDKHQIENHHNTYNFLAGIMAEQIEINSSLIVRIDRSKANYEDINDFNKLFKEKLNIKEEFNLKIFHNFSHNYKSLQVVDVIAWAYFQKYERKNQEFVNLIHLKSLIKKL